MCCFRKIFWYIVKTCLNAKVTVQRFLEPPESPFLPPASRSWGGGRAGWGGSEAQQALTWQPSTSERKRWKRKMKGEGTFAVALTGGSGADMCQRLQPSWWWRGAHGETHGGRGTHSCASCDTWFYGLLLLLLVLLKHLLWINTLQYSWTYVIQKG